MRSAAYNGSGVEAFIAEIDRLAARLRADPNWPFEPQPSAADVEREIRQLLADGGSTQAETQVKR